MNQDTSGPALPTGTGGNTPYSTGMTLRQYAAIKLKVPDSGHDWLDEMITKSIRDGIAAKVLQGICASGPSVDYPNALLTYESYVLADAMLEARK
jgi:hypothetical protein